MKPMTVPPSAPPAAEQTPASSVHATTPQKPAAVTSAAHAAQYVNRNPQPDACQIVSAAETASINANSSSGVGVRGWPRQCSTRTT